MSVVPELKIVVDNVMVMVSEGSPVMLICQVDCSCMGVQITWSPADGSSLPNGTEVCMCARGDVCVCGDVCMW